MPQGSGIALLADVKRRLPGVPVIIMTAHTDLDSAVGAFQGGAFEYLPKPFDVEKAVELIRRATSESLREEGAATEASGDENHVRPLEHPLQILQAFLSGLPTHFRIGTSAHSLGDARPQLQADIGTGFFQGLHIGVGGNELHA